MLNCARSRGCTAKPEVRAPGSGRPCLQIQKCTLMCFRWLLELSRAPVDAGRALSFLCQSWRKLSEAGVLKRMNIGPVAELMNSALTFAVSAAAAAERCVQNGP